MTANEVTTRPDFPDPLNEEQFKNQLKSGLNIVEFFSPHCSHCKSLAPTWKKTWETFYEEGQSLNITFSQVNCLLSMDLCNQEKIAYFPNIRLYGPSGFIKNFPEDERRTMENLIDFARREAYDPANAEVVDMKSLSAPLRGDSFNELLAGKGKQPYLVSFWPSKNMMSTDDEINFENCEDCLPFQRTWRVLSSKLLSHNISTGHVSCESSSRLCEELGFEDLVKIKNHSLDRLPRVALILPGNGVNNFHVYKGPFPTSASDYEDFAERVASNSKAPFISAEEIEELTKKEFHLPSSSALAAPQQRLHVVFSYDPETVVPEDLHVLGHLIEPLAEIPNAYLYRSTDNMKVVSRSVFDSMYQMINYDKKEPKKVVKEEYLDLNIMEQNPSLYIFKDGDKVPHIFPGYSSAEMRDVDYITSWIKSLSLPVVNEISPSTFANLLQFDPEEHSGLAIQLIDTSSAMNLEKSNRYLQRLIVGVYDYENVRMQNVLDVANSRRLKKTQRMQKLKEQGASARKKVNVAIEEIPRLDVNKVVVGFIDISKSNILSQLGLSHREEEYKLGDVIIIDKRGNRVYENDNSGELLNSESPYNIRETLVSVFLPGSSSHSGNIKSYPLNSSFTDYFHFLNFILHLGFGGYFCIFLIVSLGHYFYTGFKKSRKYRTKRNTIGLLGKVEKKNLRD